MWAPSKDPADYRTEPLPSTTRAPYELAVRMGASALLFAAFVALGTSPAHAFWPALLLGAIVSGLYWVGWRVSARWR